jgi:hypothetical protein
MRGGISYLDLQRMPFPEILEIFYSLKKMVKAENEA